MSQPDSASPCVFYSPGTYGQEDSVGFLMKRALGLVLQETDRRLAPHGLTNAQWGPLFKIRKLGTTTVAELARQMNMDAGAMTRMLDRLEAKELCRRVRSTTDRRVVRIELTPEGERIADEVPAVLSDVMNELLTGFSVDEWENLKSYLRRMIANGERFRGEGAG
ncbi:MarR family winged helix-turn-helix transcriptional regulator [Caldimonas thermodepolymerans]|jgi:Transcriptional regulators|uniref:MarR family transcriptional regulator n=1 Tax=Caldimonas thermodepolymerans TaxID=215580 RepID=A0AA46DH20_9BURK|nr:MarR family transcriptional regulator [Caldimonas thermodepolymerans]TCP09588.1 MarR family transcriptional regulator [Caldimonas thermodepolymerans]UZG45713.1 MarR family transcriptional regulator [Caldimonas thermodepolymerans]UZG49606.1 MarR family transcriptional regulator [Caldimonas thermodepolymerans]